ncbi:hypothetical protein U0070_003304 [Myodes glareolus]|uniref:HMG box domain-containing protein n=1 Tax=Myodes glareolus TaxID=447135 RepID=A0AAW0J9Z6_MYOGA
MGTWVTLCLMEENQLHMGKEDHKKPRGKMSSYAFCVQTCQEEHKKKHPNASVIFSTSQSSRRSAYLERWKIMSVKEKGRFEDMTKADMARYEREMETYTPYPCKGYAKKKFKDSSDVAKELREMRSNTTADDKQSYQKMAAKLKKTYEKDVAAYGAKGNPGAVKKGVVKADKSKKKKQEDEEDEEDEEERKTRKTDKEEEDGDE